MVKEKNVMKIRKSKTHHSPPPTFSLPPVSSLETEYELVSLSPNHSPKHGDFKSDYFFVPQCTLDKEGQTSMIIVGPFRVISEPELQLVLVSPGEPQKGHTMILQKRVHSPSNTPPRGLANKRITSIFQRVAADCAAKDESESYYLTGIPTDRDDGARKRKYGYACLLCLLV
ncbi:hypothetical protein PoB_000513200 [Plakobranchus ocellatus]|uniref:Uncharacterized protein n=1 Tax=Plakobranchus ocellatus TaxID=259542 RepID=A0AAV3Y825_9GAST|nr:hypothetical protein PoB_000513200 [Plakobranchus ocellatus]